ncbi:MAG TPA: GSCFA domain-containing protein [Rhizomicrobium sp.]|jgi:hypothetical protein|nr:GSCFA domain-containing protein [Rhizomicrobium sp.]
MTNPYDAKGPESFWKQAVASRAAAEICPLPAKRFRLQPRDAVATAGSCFAQNVAKFLKEHGAVRFLEAEPIAPDQPSFSALYGNIYTARQLLQLVEEASGERQPADIAWRRTDGSFVDALRPTVFGHGFPDEGAVLAARTRHREAVRALLSDCTVFVFTLGLTEAWRSARDGTVYPLAPGVAAEPARRDDFEFHNFTYEEVLGDLQRFAALLRRVNQSARVLLTVSPVPLVATYTDEHVLVATTHSKSVLRAAAGALAAEDASVYYFPAYEIITGNFSRGKYFEHNLRTITPEGVAHVMRVFEVAYGLREAPASPTPVQSPLFSGAGETVICDEEEIVKTLGF